MAADDKVNRPAEEDEDIILLTEVVKEPPSEVVLEIAAGEQELDSLFLKDSPPQPPIETSSSVDPDEDLSDFLASLKDLPEDLGTPAVPPGSPPAEPEAGGRREPRLSLTEAQLRELVREVVQETAEKLTQELAPQVTAQVLDKKIGALRQRLAEEE
jgi:hypothetical protein